jgi:putative phosphonate metabolism protein
MMACPSSARSGAPVSASHERARGDCVTKSGVARAAIYYAPATDDPLHAAASAWLGRDAETNAPIRHPDIPGIAEWTAEPRRYGFHATLKPPMRLRAGTNWDDVLARTAAVAARFAPFALPPMQVADTFGFLALRETEPSTPLQRLCDSCVEHLDDLRAPPDDAELARRRRAHLTSEQDAMLTRWGYPYVFATWFFHMTLTRRLDASEHAAIHPAADAFFADALVRPRLVTDLAIFTQAAPDQSFVIAERIPLG